MKKILSLLIICITVCTLVLPTYALDFTQANRVPPSTLSGTLTAGISYDVLTDCVIYSNETNQKIPAVGGIVRLMTAVVAETQRQNDADLSVSFPDEEYETALAGMLIEERATSAERIAMGSGSSAAQFVNLMNQTAARLGMTGTVYTNIYGNKDVRAVTTVQDTLLLAKEAFKSSNIKTMLRANTYTSIDKKLTFTRKDTFSIMDTSNKSYNRYISFFTASPFDESGFLSIAGVNSLTGREVIVITYQSGASVADYMTNYPGDILRLQRNAINDYYQSNLSGVAKSVAANLSYTLKNGTKVYVAAEIPSDQEPIKLFSNDYGIILTDKTDNCYIDVIQEQLPESAELGKILITGTLKYNNDELISVRLRTTKIETANGIIKSENYTLYNVEDGAKQAERQYNKNNWISAVGSVILISAILVVVAEFVRRKFI